MPNNIIKLEQEELKKAALKEQQKKGRRNRINPHNTVVKPEKKILKASKSPNSTHATNIENSNYTNIDHQERTESTWIKLEPYKYHLDVVRENITIINNNLTDI